MPEIFLSLTAYNHFGHQATTTDHGSRRLTKIVINVNGQSLTVHIEDIPTHLLLLRAADLAITETWTDSEASMKI